MATVGKQIRIRAVCENDFARINKLLADADFDDGEHILALLFRNCETAWRVAENENGEIVATSCAHKLRLKERTAMFRDYNNVRVDYQGFGLIRPLRSIYENYPTVGNSSPNALIKMSRFFTKFDTKLVGYIGIPKNTLAKVGELASTNGFEISPVTRDDDVQNLLDYDKATIDIDRAQFMREWCAWSAPSEPYARTVIAKSKKDGRVSGFGTIRLFTRTYEVQPLYADGPDAALGILNELIRLYISEITDVKPVRMYFFANNSTLLKCVKKLKLTQTTSQVRSYSKGSDGKDIAQELDTFIRYRSVYCTMYYWPV